MKAKISNINETHRQKLSTLEKFALIITEKVGTMGFFFIVLLWTVLWMAWNVFGPDEKHFDPYPAFVTWLFISNMIQLFLMPLIMIGQNIQSKHAELMAERHYDADIKADKQVGELKSILNENSKLLKSILEKLEK
jgi:uncharacterized membrane protein